MNINSRTVVFTLFASFAAGSTAFGSILVSNLAEANHLSATVDNNFQVAQSFVAGGNSTLDAVTLQLSLNPPGAGLTLKLYSDTTGSPSASALVDFQLDSGTRFTPAATLSLTAGLTYWVVASASAPLVSWDGTSSVNDAGTSGWSMGNDHREKGFGGPWGIVSDSLKMSVEATSLAVPEPDSVAGMTALGLTSLALVRHLRKLD